MTGENDFDQDNKRSNRSIYDDALADGKFQLRLLIPSRLAGPVIGKGGAFINAIRTKFGADVTIIPDKSITTSERVLSIICSQGTIIDCFTEIYKKLAEDEPVVRMLIHQSHVRPLIGPFGTKIKELEKQTNSYLWVFREQCPRSNDCLLWIAVDQQERMSETVKAIIAYLKEVPIKGNRYQYYSANFDPNLGYGGYACKSFNFGGGGRGSGGDGGRRDSYCGPPPPQYGGPSKYGQYGGGGYGGGGYGYPPPPGYQEEVQSTQVTVPSELIGAIIGKDGQTIDHIRNVSRARIKIDTSKSTHGIITITGTSQQIQLAQYFLDSVRKSTTGCRYLNQH